MITLLFRFAFYILFFVSFESCQKQINNNSFIETEPPILQANELRVNNVIGGFYSALPSHYRYSNKDYPLLVFLHGAGQIGNGSTDLPLILHEGVPELLSNKEFPPSFKVKGQNFSFIILAPQFSSFPSTEEVESFVVYARNKYRVDKRRIYFSGLSMGGIVTSDMGAQYTSQLAAIVPISGVSSFADSAVYGKCKNVAVGNLPVWVFQNDSDLVANVNSARNYVSLIMTFHPAIIPKYTQFLPWGLNNHDAWTRATNPHYKEDNMNMYEWMLQYTR